MNREEFEKELKEDREKRRNMLRELVYSRFGSIAEFSRVTGINTSSLSRYLSGKGDMLPDKMQHAFDCAGARLCLITPHGDMIVMSNLSEEKKEWLDINYWKTDEIESFDDNSSEFEKLVESSLNDSDDIRTARLEVANKIPKKVSVVTKVFQRNPDVVAEVLSRAKGVCEYCNKQAPFVRSKDGKPYLEVHHKLRLSRGGEDTVENAIAVCPNCHRELHYG